MANGIAPRDDDRVGLICAVEDTLILKFLHCGYTIVSSFNLSTIRLQ